MVEHCSVVELVSFMVKHGSVGAVGSVVSLVSHMVE